jgi:hypothetical protein
MGPLMHEVSLFCEQANRNILLLFILRNFCFSYHFLKNLCFSLMSVWSSQGGGEWFRMYTEVHIEIRIFLK